MSSVVEVCSQVFWVVRAVVREVIMQQHGPNDNYDYEEQQEKIAMMKTIYLPMKNWFASLDPQFSVSSPPSRLPSHLI
jgi:hypothetical protein